jgi:hypothetical protein
MASISITFGINVWNVFLKSGAGVGLGFLFHCGFGEQGLNWVIGTSFELWCRGWVGLFISLWFQ